MDYAKLSNKAMVEWLLENKPNDIALQDAYCEAAKARVENGVKKMDLKAAKHFFYNEFKNEIEFTNAPKEKKKSSWDILMEWTKRK